MDDRQPVDYSKIQITNDYMFMTVLIQHPEICLTLLRYMLPHIEICKVEFKEIDTAGVPHAQPNVQQTMSPGIEAHGIRLDVYYDDGNSVFDVEMHNGVNGKDPYLPLRTRYTHGVIDSTLLKRREHYGKLRPCYVIYICTFDPFNKGLFLYTVKKRIVEDSTIEYEDGDYTLYFNTEGTVGELPEPMKEILKYINDPESFPVERTGVDVIQRIDAAVKFNQQSAEWRAHYNMFMLSQMDAEFRGEERGEARGKTIGKTEAYKNFAIKMIRANNTDLEIHDMTELSISEIQKLREQYA